MRSLLFNNAVSGVPCDGVRIFEGAMQTKYKFGSLKRRRCPDNNDTVNSVQILRETDEEVAAEETFLRLLCDVT